MHALVTGRRLVIGGVEIPFERGLAGHSDADVLLHAITDALLGAAGAAHAQVPVDVLHTLTGHTDVDADEGFVHRGASRDRGASSQISTPTEPLSGLVKCAMMRPH